MNEIIDGFIKAFQLIVSGNPTVYNVALRSLLISGAATLIAVLWGTPASILIGLKEFRGKLLIKSFFNTMIGIPTVALGLILYLVFSRAGPLGFLHLLYTPSGIIIGEAILVTPIVISFVTSAIEAVDLQILNLAKTLGASDSQASVAVIREASNGIFLAGTACFNRAIAELGVALVVGGNIVDLTEVLTTSISRQTQIGNLDVGIALSIILMVIVFGITLTLSLLRRGRKWIPLWS